MYSVTSFTVQGGSLWEEADPMLHEYSLMYSMTSYTVQGGSQWKKADPMLHNYSLMYSVTSSTVQGGSLWEKADQMLHNYSLMYSMTSSSVHIGKESVWGSGSNAQQLCTANVFYDLFLCIQGGSLWEEAGPMLNNYS